MESESRITNMTAGNPLFQIFFFALPLMLGNVFQQLYTVVDTAVVGQALGVTALAALGASEWFNWLMLSSVQGITQGFSILISQRFGADDIPGLKKAAGHAIALSAISSVALLIFGQIAAPIILNILHTPEEIVPISLFYMRILYAGIPITMTYNLLSSILRALGDGKTPLQAMAVASVSNIVLDLLFVLVFHLGVGGAAAATLIAQVIASSLCYLQFRKIEILHLSKEDYHLSGALSRRLFWLGTPMAAQNIMIALGGMFVQSVVNPFGVIFLAGYTATNKLYGMLEIAAVSYGYAVTTYVGQNMGARKLYRISLGMRAALLIGTITSLIICGIMFLSGDSILGLFITGTAVQVEESMKYAFDFLKIMSFNLPILYLLHVVRSALYGLGNTLLPMLSGLGELLMRILSAIFITGWIGSYGVFYAEIMAWVGADLVLIISYFYRMRQVRREIAGSTM